MVRKIVSEPILHDFTMVYSPRSAYHTLSLDHVSHLAQYHTKLVQDVIAEARVETA